VEPIQLDPETEVSSVYWVQLSRFHQTTRTDFVLRNAEMLFLIKDMTVDNVQFVMVIFTGFVFVYSHSRLVTKYHQTFKIIMLWNSITNVLVIERMCNPLLLE
jgi:hypothetical protein